MRRSRPTEFRLLAALAARPGEVVRRAALVAAGWPEGAIVHENTLDAYLTRIRRRLREVDADEAVTTVRGRRVPARMSLRARLIRSSLLTLFVGLGALLVCGNVLLAVRTRSESATLLQARADAQLAALTVTSTRITVRAVPNDDVLDRQAWVLQGDRGHRTAGGSARRRRCGGRLARSGGRPSRLRGARRRTSARSFPPSRPGPRGRRERSSSPCRSAPWNVCRRRCCSGSFVFAALLMLGRRPRDARRRRRSAAARRTDDRGRRILGRARSRRSLRARPTPGTSSPASPPPSTGSWPESPPPAGTSSASRARSPTSSGIRSPGSGAGPSSR